MNRCILATILIWTGCNPGVQEVLAPAKVGAVGARLDSLIKVTTDSGFSGVVLVALNDQVILHQAYGYSDSAHTTPLSPGTRFNIASISKQFTAATILRMAEAGQLRISDSIGRFFPAVPANGSAITLFQLITHTSGLGQAYAADGVADLDSALAAVFSVPRDSAGPFSYSNDGYSILAGVIERASGMRFEDMVRTMLLEPAGLARTAFWGEVPVEDPAETAQPVERFTPEMLRPNWGFRGGTGMWSTATDLYHWLLQIRDSSLLSPEGGEALWGRQVEVRPGLEAGFGWFTSQTPWGVEIWTRGTEGFGHNAVLRWFPDRRAVIIVMANCGAVMGAPANQSVSNLLVEHLFDQPATGTGG